LIVRQSEDAVATMQALTQEVEIHAIYTHEETGNDWTYQRDIRMEQWCRASHIALKAFPSNGVVRALKSRDHWSAIRNARMNQPVLPAPTCLRSVKVVNACPLPEKESPIFGESLLGTVQPGGRAQAEQTLACFLQQHASQYLYHLSAPGLSEQYCSRLSTHLAYGTLSAREVHAALLNRLQQLTVSDKKSWARGLSAFNSRLSWRDHFIQKLEDQPEIEYQCMHPGFEQMRDRPGNKQWMHAWQMGKTGYPFVDACMRSLKQTGWITFRMRAMLVSFASYHLWLDWRDSGYFLARMFTDYEPGIHYSQLQMQSGVTGINALRMYNPVKQSQDQDPDGVFIKKWVPELARFPQSYIHEPWTCPPLIQSEAGVILGRDYPLPIVDHTTAIRAARAKISSVRQQIGFKHTAKQVYQKLGSRKRAASQKNRHRKDKQTTASVSVQIQLDLIG
jgi:deoxyribodipyrimidine photo-lyase